MKRLLLLSLATILLSACSKLYEVNSKVESVECNRTEGYHTKVSLDNGGAYYYASDSYCNIKNGTDVIIIHNDEYYIKSILIKGTKEYNPHSLDND